MYVLKWSDKSIEKMEALILDLGNSIEHEVWSK